MFSELIHKARDKGASDIHLTTGRAPTVRINGTLEVMDEFPEITKDSIVGILRPILPEGAMGILENFGEEDFALDVAGVRLRVNIFWQKDAPAAAVRLLPVNIPSMEDLGLPPVVRDLAMLPRGLVLVTGPTGSGKSTTLASMINYINENRKCHILTVEDPIEYIHNHKNCLVNQRETGRDTKSFCNALISALREDPDVILVGEMRDIETMQAAITAAETGHLVLSTLHTLGSAKTVDRIIDVFPGETQKQIRAQLAETIAGVVSQQLLPKADGSGRIAALEIMTRTDAISNMVREGKTHQIASSIQTGKILGMQLMDNTLSDYVKRGIITREVARERCFDPRIMDNYL